MKKYRIILAIVLVLIIASASLQVQALEQVFVCDFFENMGYQVDWDSESNAVLISDESGDIRWDCL